MEIGFDLVGLAAIFIALRIEYRNNWPVLKVLKCDGSEGVLSIESPREPYGEFRITIRNLGITLHDPTIDIAFTDPRGWGTNRIPLLRRSEFPSKNGEFARGMIAEFGLKSLEMSEHQKEMLYKLQDVARQDVRLIVFSQGFLAKRLRVGGWVDRFREMWNRWATRFNMLVARKIGTNEMGMDVIKGGRLPLFTTLAWPLSSFIRSLQPKENTKLAS